MLRISSKDESDVREFQNVHPEGKKRDFGRLFRSPSLFEDAVKSILLCNCTWVRTLMMARALCELQLKLTTRLISNLSVPKRKGLKRKRASNESNEASNLLVSDGEGNFPSPKELASLNEAFLRKHCNLGYRACQILELATSVESGKLQLMEFEKLCELPSSEKIYAQLVKINGFGHFACANLLLCIGFYDNIPVDTETIRHLRQVHGRRDCSKGNARAIIAQIYGEYAPFQCLAYWLELCNYYESSFGKLSKLPRSSYSMITGSRNHKSSGGGGGGGNGNCGHLIKLTNN